MILINPEHDLARFGRRGVGVGSDEVAINQVGD